MAMAGTPLSLGIDIGSVTVKLVLFEGKRLVRTEYRRFRGRPFETLCDVLDECFSELKGKPINLGHTGIGVYTYFRPGDASWFVSVGDYDMVYNGNGVVTSKRWEAVRDGVEDYTMLHTLRQAANAAEDEGRHPAIVKEARRVCGEEALAIGKFCNWGRGETVPGKTGMPGARRLADEQWETIQRTRRNIARLLVALKEKL